MEKLEWKVNTPRLFSEILANEGLAIMLIPLNITLGLLHQVAVRCSQLDDSVLNGLMVQLALYECANPESEAFSAEKVAELIKGKRQALITGK